MKKWLVLISIFFTITLSGCSFANFETDKLIHPPKASGEMSEIVQVIENISGTDLHFKYPQNGDYRSAIIMKDINNDGETEAVAMYQIGGEESTTHVMIIGKIGGKYSNLGHFQYQSSEVDKVCFGDVNGNGVQEIFIGWSSYNNSGKTITMYYNETAYISQVLDETYSDFVVADFDEDGTDELLTLSLSKNDSSSNIEIKNSEREANAKLIKCSQETINDSILYKFNAMGNAPMDSSSIKYTNTLFGSIDGIQNGIVVDSMISGNVVTTEIIYWDKQNKNLVAPLYNSKTHKSDLFYRESLLLSSDINGDGIIEIPSIDSYQYMSYKNEAYILSWISYKTKTNETYSVMEYITNDADGYILGIPNKWTDIPSKGYNVLIKYDSPSKRLTVTEKITSGNNVAAGTDLIGIEVFYKDDWAAVKDKTDFMELETTSDKVYVAKVFNSTHPLSIGLEEIKSLFSLN